MKIMLRSAACLAFLNVLAAFAVAAETPGKAIVNELPEPFATPSAVKHPKVIGWPEGKSPTAPDGFVVTAFATDIATPRWIYVLPNGDVLVAQSKTEKLSGEKPAEEKRQAKQKSKQVGESPNRVMLFRDTDGDGAPDQQSVLLEDLRQPFGMLLLDNHLYVANTDSVVRYPYEDGQTQIEAEEEKVLDLPAGGYNNHWTRNLIASRDGKKLYVTVGSQTNVDEEKRDVKDERRAAILQFNPDGSEMRVFAGGLRNPNGMGWAPGTDTLYTVVNERDGLGDDLVPDYLTSVQDGGFYGWPYAYFGIEEPRKKGERPELVAKSLIPDYPLGSHTASLGLVFYEHDAFPSKYHGGAFIGQRGSWNRSEFSGYRVAYVPFKAGKPSGEAEDFLTGFIANEDEVYGRPVGVAVAKDGALLVADDSGNRVWRVAVKQQN